jgi:hypothetical protein
MPICCGTSSALEPNSTKTMPKVAIVYYSMCAAGPPSTCRSPASQRLDAPGQPCRTRFRV